MFHVELCTIPEVKGQLSNEKVAVRAQLSRDLQVRMMQNVATEIRKSVALQSYFRVMRSMGSLMNHGRAKGCVYGFKLVRAVPAERVGAHRDQEAQGGRGGGKGQPAD